MLPSKSLSLYKHQTKPTTLSHSFTFSTFFTFPLNFYTKFFLAPLVFCFFFLVMEFTAAIKGNKMQKEIIKELEAHQNGFEAWWNDFSLRLVGTKYEGKSFRSFLNMSRKTFSYIVCLVKPNMGSKQVNIRDNNGMLLTINDRVAVSLIRLSFGESLSAVGDLLGINPSTVSKFTNCFVEAMEEVGLQHLHWPSEMKETKSLFANLGGLPNCCGAVDVTHVLMVPSSKDAAHDICRDREDNASMIVQAIVGPDMRFLDIVTGWPGSLSDSEVLETSRFFQLAQKRKVLNGEKVKISKEVELGEYLVGDTGFPLMPWLLTPYKRRNLLDTEIKLNEKIYATIKVARRALARLKDRWSVINGEMRRPDKDRLPRIILVCCILHNIVIDLEGVGAEKEECLSHEHDPGYGQQTCVTGGDEKALAIREKLALYLSRELSE